MAMILYAGFEEIGKWVSSLAENGSLIPVASADQAIENDMLKNSEVFILGPGITNPVKEIQKIAAADKYISIIIAATPTSLKHVKQSLQFAPFLGKNTLTISLGPELDLKGICDNAILRTRQRRRFHKMNISGQDFFKSHERISITQMGSFLEHAPIGAILLDDTDHIVNYNQQAKALFSILGKSEIILHQLFNNADIKQVKEFIHQPHDPSERKDVHVGKYILELTSTEVFSEDGNKYFLLLFNDVTNERLEGLRIQAILESLPQMAWTTNTDGEVTYFTNSWFFYTGQTKEEALGKGWIAVVHDEEKDNVSRQWEKSVLSGKSYQQVVRFRTGNGEYRWHLSRASVVRNHAGEPIMWVGTSTDIHDQVLLTEELERKVKERTRSLEISNSELEQFAHVSSHDLQEPLRKIRTFADMLKNKSIKGLDDDAKKYIEKIVTTANRMSGSLKALLNYTKLHNEEAFSKVDLNEVVAHVQDDLEMVILQKSAVIKVDKLPAINAVSIQMQQVFYNLLNNSLKFSKPGEAPFIQVSARMITDEERIQYPQLNKVTDYYLISIKDNGIGFEQKYAKKIFTIFQRLHNKSEFEGTGIGLSLVKKVMDNHKGLIYAISEPGKGTEFRIILPAQKFSEEPVRTA